MWLPIYVSIFFIIVIYDKQREPSKDNDIRIICLFQDISTFCEAGKKVKSTKLSQPKTPPSIGNGIIQATVLICPGPKGDQGKSEVQPVKLSAVGVLFRKLPEVTSDEEFLLSSSSFLPQGHEQNSGSSRAPSCFDKDIQKSSLHIVQTL